MKILSTIFAASLLLLQAGLADDSFEDSPLTAKDLKEILELNVQKYQINFEHAGFATMEIAGYGSGDKFSIHSQSESATIMVYIERGPDSRGSSIKGIDTLHYWFSAGNQTRYSYITFDSTKSKLTTYGLNEGIFSIIAKPESDSEEVGYSIKVTSEKHVAKVKD